MSQAKYWCFTQNNDPEAFRNGLELLVGRVAGLNYLCGQLERGAEGHLHFQGYCQLARSQRLSWVRNNISDTAHWEISRGTTDQARDYCRKTDGTEVADTFVEFGEYVQGRAGQGNRTDIVAYRDMILAGASKRTIMDSMPLELAKYDRFYHTVRSVSRPRRREGFEFRVILYVGEPGTGKTRLAYENHPELFEIPLSNGQFWYDGYDNHEAVLLDDFIGRGSKMRLDTTLKLLDLWYIRQVPIKGGHTWWTPQTIIITSNYHPRAWYNWSNREASYAALMRRITEVWTFQIGQEPVEEDKEEYFMDREIWPAEWNNDNN